jgi:hypothetical protein
MSETNLFQKLFSRKAVSSDDASTLPGFDSTSTGVDGAFSEGANAAGQDWRKPLRHPSPLAQVLKALRSKRAALKFQARNF